MKPRPKRDFKKSVIDPEKKRQRIVLIFSLVVVVLMVVGVAEVALYRGNDTTTQTKYGQYEFTYQNRGTSGTVIVATINNQEIEFQNLPTGVGQLSVDPRAITLMKAAQHIVLVVDPNMTTSDAATADYARLMLGLAIPKTGNAISTPDERFSMPVINCTAASPQTVVVMFNLSNSTSVVADGSCITLNGEQRDVLSLKDRLIFEYYDILQDGQVKE